MHIAILRFFNEKKHNEVLTYKASTERDLRSPTDGQTLSLLFYLERSARPAFTIKQPHGLMMQPSELCKLCMLKANKTRVSRPGSQRVNGRQFLLLIGLPLPASQVSIAPTWTNNTPYKQIIEQHCIKLVVTEPNHIDPILYTQPPELNS